MSIDAKHLTFQTFFDDLTTCLFESNFDLLPSFFGEPWVFVRGDEHIVVSRSSSVRSKLEKATALLLEKGAEQWSLDFKKVIPINDQDYFVNVTWKFSNNNAKDIISFSHSYLVKLKHNLPQIITVVSDNELDFYSGF